MRRVLFVVFFLCVGSGATPAAAELFTEDFNRPDGPLGLPWELRDESTLYIDTGRAVAHAGEYGLMAYTGLCEFCGCE